MEYDEQMEERKEKIAAYLDSPQYIPMRPDEICVMLSVPAEGRADFDGIVKDLIREGRAVETKKGKLMTPAMLNMRAGAFISHPKGFGFVSTGVLGERDIFIPADAVGGAMHKDRVLVRLGRQAVLGKRAEGEVVAILERGKKEIVGAFEKGRGFGFVIPDDKKIAKDIFISEEYQKGAVTGHKVVVKITKWPEGRRSPEGRIVEILGHVNDPGVDILSIVREYELPMEFPEKVLHQVEQIESVVSKEELSGREDFREWKMVTIDGEDAKDLDDAVSLCRLPDGLYRLGVHIADVSHYVKENSPLDREAYERGTSVYLVDRVIPMLPHKLSNGICSLNPKEDRLALSCVMDINARGEVVAHRIVKSVICTNERMTYTDVNRIITEQDDALSARYEGLTDMFQEMETLRQILLRKRRKRGSVNFDLPESKIFLDENGKPLEIKPYERNAATSMIEEFMLVCNETIAEEYFWQGMPFVFRSHETPDDEKVHKLSEFLANFGYRIKGMQDLKPKAVSEILSLVEGKPEEHIISRVVLRSMKQARYTAENGGHFGLAARYYCHFTSPIRRYPDLQIHRIIKENLSGGISEKRMSYLKKQMPEVSRQCSVRERVADEAERETDNLKKVEFMEDKIGNVYQGMISGVTGWGIYVELPNTVEGMIAVAELEDDFYTFIEEKMMFIGERHKKIYRLGDTVYVQVARVSKELRQIDFTFAEAPEEEAEQLS